MSDYISREAAKILMCDACKYDCTPDRRASGQSLITADDCYQLRDLYNAPAADVAPVIHAHWCEDPVFDNFYYCSHCYAGFKSDYTVLVDEKYCGNCGARMDESEFAKDTNVPDRNESEDEEDSPPTETILPMSAKRFC